MEPGQVVDGRYRVVKRLGAGGMAQVWLASDQVEHTRVALKVLAASRAAANDEFVTRFRREFEACARVEHPNVVRLHRLGTLPDGSWYYAMEYLPTPSLDALLEREGRLSQDLVHRYVSQIGDAFAHLHPQGVIHRDLKPANIITCGSSRVVLVDFGLAKDLTHTAVTATGAIVGTPLYMTPEQIRGQDVDGRTDIFALGVVTYQMLTGCHPFASADLPTLARRILDRQPPPPSTVVEGVSPAWDPFVARCMAKDRGDRYPDAVAMDEGLVAVGVALGLVEAPGAEEPAPDPPLATRRRVGRPAVSSPSIPVPRPAETPPALPPSADLRPSPPRVLPFLLVLGLVAVGGFLWLRGSVRPVYGVHGLATAAIPGGVVVTWASDGPYPSRVVVDGRVSSPVVGDGGQDGLSHRVLVSGQEEGRPLTVQVMYPSGELSLPVQVVAGRFGLSLSGVRQEGSRLLAIWECPAGPGATFCLEYSPGEPPVVGRPAEGGTTWTMELPGEPAKLLGGDLVVRLGDGSERRMGLGAALVRQAERLAGRFGGLDARRMLEAVKDRVDRALPAASEAFARERGLTDLSLERLQSMRAELLSGFVDEELGSRGWFAATAETATLAPFLFENPTLPMPVRMALYQGVVRVLLLYLYCDAQGAVKLPALPPVPHLGDVGVSDVPTVSGGARIVLWEPKDEPLYLGTPTPSPVRRPAPSLSLRVRIPAEAFRERAELQLDMTAMSRFVLRVVVNGEGEFVVWDRPLFPHHGGERRVLLCQRIPPGVLHVGENTIELRAERILDDPSEARSRIFGVVLALGGGR